LENSRDPQEGVRAAARGSHMPGAAQGAVANSIVLTMSSGAVAEP
jgi:hypothetical protein